MRWIGFILTLFFSTSYAKFEWNRFDKSSLQVGTWLENYAQVRATRSDQVGGFGLTPFISLASEYRLDTKKALIPEMGYVWQQNRADIYKNIFFTRLDFAYKLNELIRTRFGSGLFLTTQSGSGEADMLNNANTTATYYIPKERRDNYTQTLDLGLELMQKEISWRAQTYIITPFDPQTRQLTLSLSINFYTDTQELWR